MFKKCSYRKASLPLALLAGTLLAAVIPLESATGEDSSPYLIGQWKLNDYFSDFKRPDVPIAGEDTEFVFLNNPTQQTLTLADGQCDAPTTVVARMTLVVCSHRIYAAGKYAA